MLSELRSLFRVCAIVCMVFTVGSASLSAGSRTGAATCQDEDEECISAVVAEQRSIEAMRRRESPPLPAVKTVRSAASAPRLSRAPRYASLKLPGGCSRLRRLQV